MSFCRTAQATHPPQMNADLLSGCCSSSGDDSTAQSAEHAAAPLRNAYRDAVDTQRRAIAACLTCPLTGRLMTDPVILCDTGYTFERAAIEARLLAGKRTCPASGTPLASAQLKSNMALRALMADLHLPLKPLQVR